MGIHAAEPAFFLFPPLSSRAFPFLLGTVTSLNFNEGTSGSRGRVCMLKTKKRKKKGGEKIASENSRGEQVIQTGETKTVT